MFPGNVRELSNIINHSIIMSDNEKFIDNIILEQIRPFPSGDERLGSNAGSDHQSLAQQMAVNEKNIIKNALKQNSTAIAVAKVLGIGKATMIRKQKKYHLLKKDRGKSFNISL